MKRKDVTNALGLALGAAIFLGLGWYRELRQFPLIGQLLFVAAV